MVEIRVCDCADKHGHVFKDGVNISSRIDSKSQIPEVIGQLRESGQITHEDEANVLVNVSNVELPD